MHGDKMKKTIQLNYKSIFKYDDHHETVKYQSKGTYVKDDKKERITFYQNDKKIEITMKGNDVLLVNGNAMLNLSYHRRVFNYYQTPYGLIELYTELVTLEHERNIKLIYMFYDGKQKISEVYVLINYEFME